MLAQLPDFYVWYDFQLAQVKHYMLNKLLILSIFLCSKTLPLSEFFITFFAIICDRPGFRRRSRMSMKQMQNLDLMISIQHLVETQIILSDSQKLLSYIHEYDLSISKQTIPFSFLRLRGRMQILFEVKQTQTSQTSFGNHQMAYVVCGLLWSEKSSLINFPPYLSLPRDVLLENFTVFCSLFGKTSYFSFVLLASSFIPLMEIIIKSVYCICM